VLCGIIIMFDMSIESFAELASFLSPLLGVPAQEITPEKRLFHDFGIDGDDLLEILLPLRDKHGLDISDFDPTPYFGYELVAGYRHAFHRLTSFRYCALLPFTVGDLYRAVQQGKLEGRSSERGADAQRR
jgi:acyl carrier protein